MKCKKYGKYSKILNTWLVIMAGTCQMLVRKANLEDPDQTASSEAVSSEAVSSGSTLFVRSGSPLFVLAFVAGNYCLNF